MRKRFYVYLVIVIAIMITIFAFSAQEGNLSAETSESAAAWVQANLGALFSESAIVFITENIRKIAHCGIYMVLGIFVSLLVREIRRPALLEVGAGSEYMGEKNWDDMMVSQVFQGKTIGGMDDRPLTAFVSMGLGKQSGYNWNADPETAHGVLGSGLGILGAVSALIICVVYAATDELHQYFVVERSAEITDIVIDGAGALIGILLIWIICGIIGAIRNR